MTIDLVNAPGTRSFLVRHGLTPIDAVASIAALLLATAYQTDFLLPSWAPRMAVVLTVLPIGLVVLVRRLLVRDHLAMAAFAVLASALVSAALSEAPRLVILGVVGSETGVVLLASALGLMMIGSELTLAGRRALGWSAIAGIGLSCAVGLLQIVVQAESGPFVAPGGRASGLTPSSVYFGAAAAAGFAIVLGRRSIRKRTTMIDVALAAWFGLAIGLSGTRVALGAAVLLGVVVVAWRRDVRTTMVAGGVVAGVVVGQLVVATVQEETNVLDRVKLNGGGRTTAWRYAADSFLDRPVFGFGSGRFRYAIQDDVSVDFARLTRANIEGVWFNAHNFVFDWAVTGGAVGLLTVAVLAFVLARRSRGMLALGGCALALSWLLQPYSLATFPLALLLLGAGCARSDADGPSAVLAGSATSGSEISVDNDVVGEQALAAPVTASSFRGASAWWILPGLALGLYVMVVDWSIKAALERRDPAAVAAWVERMPADPIYADIVAQSWQRGFPENPDAGRLTREWGERQTAMQPDRAYWWVRHGRRLAQIGEPDEALRALAEARRFEPNSWEAVQGQYFILQELGRDAEVAELLPLVCALGIIECEEDFDSSSGALVPIEE